MIDRCNRFIDMSKFYDGRIIVCMLNNEKEKKIIGINEFVLENRISEKEIEKTIIFQQSDYYEELLRLQEELIKIKDENNKDIVKKLLLEYQNMKKVIEKEDFIKTEIHEDKIQKIEKEQEKKEQEKKIKYLKNIERKKNIKEQELKIIKNIIETNKDIDLKLIQEKIIEEKKKIKKTSRSDF